MLYDNAQLARVYLHAWSATDNEFFQTITKEILDYVVRDMTDAEGGFYSSQARTPAARAKRASSLSGRRGRYRKFLGTMRMPS